MNARTLAVLGFAAAVGAFASAPVHAQDTMAGSSSSAMAHDAMHKDDMKMKKDAMKPDSMKHGAMKSKAMHKGDMKMKKDDATKMKQDAGDAMKSGD